MSAFLVYHDRQPEETAQSDRQHMYLVCRTWTKKYRNLAIWVPGPETELEIVRIRSCYLWLDVQKSAMPVQAKIWRNGTKKGCDNGGSNKHLSRPKNEYFLPKKLLLNRHNSSLHMSSLSAQDEDFDPQNRSFEGPNYASVSLLKLH